jgi:hypothetical protein
LPKEWADELGEFIPTENPEDGTVDEDHPQSDTENPTPTIKSPVIINEPKARPRPVRPQISLVGEPDEELELLREYDNVGESNHTPSEIPLEPDVCHT